MDGHRGQALNRKRSYFSFWLNVDTAVLARLSFRMTSRSPTLWHLSSLPGSAYYRECLQRPGGLGRDEGIKDEGCQGLSCFSSKYDVV